MSLEVNGARVGRTGDEVDHLRVLRIAYVHDRDAIAEGVADIGIAAMYHDLDAVAAAGLVRMAHEPDVAGCDGIHPGFPIWTHSPPGHGVERADHPIGQLTNPFRHVNGSDGRDAWTVCDPVRV